jgi:hypothetical protein
MKILEIDKYTLKARLYPSFIVLFPAFVVSFYYITDFEKYYHYLTALISLGFLTFLLSQLGRDRGKLKELELYELWGGKPSSQILRHTNNYLDSPTKARYHKLLSKQLPDLQLPTVEQEQNDIKQADQVYASCTRYLISKTRDTEKFALLIKENINYGFRRNLWGMKIWGLIVLLGCFIIHSYFTTNKFTTFEQFSVKDICLFSFLLLIAIFWFVKVTPKWIKMPAFCYAERLYETLDTFEISKP